MQVIHRLFQAPVVELADTLDSGSSARKGVEVRILSGVPLKNAVPQGQLFLCILPLVSGFVKIPYLPKIPQFSFFIGEPLPTKGASVRRKSQVLFQD